MGQNDIKYLKLKLQQHILNEEYEKAATIKKWIEDLESKKKKKDG
jgi:protein-arginine kinase activator protein McsA